MMTFVEHSRVYKEPNRPATRLSVAPTSSPKPQSQEAASAERDKIIVGVQ